MDGLIWLAVLFLVLALVAYILGARGIAGFSLEIARWLVIDLCYPGDHRVPVRWQGVLTGTSVPERLAGRGMFGQQTSYRIERPMDNGQSYPDAPNYTFYGPRLTDKFKYSDIV